MKRLSASLTAFAVLTISIEATELNLDTAVSFALTYNLALQAVRFDIQVAEARSIDARKLPNPELEFSTRRSQATGDDREGSLFAGFSQKFPVTDRLSRIRHVRQSEIDLAYAELRNAERLLVDQVLDSFVRAQAATERVAVMEELRRGTEDYLKLAEQRLASALGSELNVASARTELLLAEQTKSQAESEVREALADLRPLLGMKPDAELEVSGDVAWSIAHLQKSVRLTEPRTFDRADVAVARVNRERAERLRRLADAERWEDWEFVMGYENERSVDEPKGAERDHFFGVGIRIPLPLRRKGLDRIAETQAEAAKAGKILEAAQAASLAEVARGIEAVRQAETLADALDQKTLPLIEERAEMTREAYTQGLIDFSEVLQLQQQKARLREALVESRLNHALALVSLQTALGSNPILSKQSNKP